VTSENSENAEAMLNLDPIHFLPGQEVYFVDAERLSESLTGNDNVLGCLCTDVKGNDKSIRHKTHKVPLLYAASESGPYSPDYPSAVGLTI